MKMPFLGAIVLAVIAAAGGFYGGMTYAQAQAQNTTAEFFRQRAVVFQNVTPDPNDPCGLGNCVARGQIKSVRGDTIEISTAVKVVTVKVNDETVITNSPYAGSEQIERKT